jgi:hypothetical protein
LIYNFLNKLSDLESKYIILPKIYYLVEKINTAKKKKNKKLDLSMKLFSDDTLNTNNGGINSNFFKAGNKLTNELKQSNNNFSSVNKMINYNPIMNPNFNINHLQSLTNNLKKKNTSNINDFPMFVNNPNMLLGMGNIYPNVNFPQPKANILPQKSLFEANNNNIFPLSNLKYLNLIIFFPRFK